MVGPGEKTFKYRLSEGWKTLFSKNSILEENHFTNLVTSINRNAIDIRSYS